MQQAREPGEQPYEPLGLSPTFSDEIQFWK
jgi:hypothetical protein